MSEQTAGDFLQRLIHDAGLRREAAEALAAVAGRHGFDCTATDCERIFQPVGPVAEGELADDALSAVAGGAGAPVLGHAISLSFSQQSDGLGQRNLKR